MAPTVQFEHMHIQMYFAFHISYIVFILYLLPIWKRIYYMRMADATAGDVSHRLFQSIEMYFVSARIAARLDMFALRYVHASVRQVLQRRDDVCCYKMGN